MPRAFLGWGNVTSLLWSLRSGAWWRYKELRLTPRYGGKTGWEQPTVLTGSCWGESGKADLGKRCLVTPTFSLQTTLTFCEHLFVKVKVG